MIIEYTGEVVRPCLTDKRERENEEHVRCLDKNYNLSLVHRVLVVTCSRLIQ